MSIGAAAGDGILRGIFEGCIAGGDVDIQRRPYHKNCKCALHRTRGHCGHSASFSQVSFRIRRTSSEGCLALMSNAADAKQACPLSTAGKLARTRTQLVLYEEDEEDSDQV